MAPRRKTVVPCMDCGLDLNDPFHATPEGFKEHQRLSKERKALRSQRHNARRERQWAAVHTASEDLKQHLAKPGEEACGYQWLGCAQYEGQPHECAIKKGHKTSAVPHTCGSCFDEKRPRARKGDVAPGEE